MGAVDAHASLRKVLGYAGTAIVDEACVHIPVPRSAIGPDGLIADATTRRRIVECLTALADVAVASAASGTPGS